MSKNGAPAKMVEQDQKEGSATATTKPSPQRKNKIIPMSPRGARFKEAFLSKIVPWEKLTASLDNFPQYIEENTKTLLMECVASHLKQKKLRKNRGHFTSSSERILLQSIPGTELYRERLVSTLARELQVPLMKLDSSVLPPYDLSADFSTDGGADCSDYVEYDDDDDDDEFSDDGDDDDDDEEFTAYEKVNIKVCEFKKGDRVMYVGKTIFIEEANNRTLSVGQRGEVYEVKGEKVAVVFNICGLKTTRTQKDEGNTETSRKALVTWLDVKNVKKDLDAQTHDYVIGMEALYEVLESQPPMIVYFPDSFLWPSKPFNTRKGLQNPFIFQSMPYDMHRPFPGKMKETFDQLPEGVVMICAENKSEPGSEEMEKFPEFRKRDIERLQGPRGYRVSEMQKLFTNVVCIKPPQDQDHLNAFNKQIEEDRLKVISDGNLSTMHKVLKAHNLACMDLKNANVEDMILTRENVEKIIGWATNHYLSSCPFPHVNNEKLHIPHESIKLAIMRFTEEETQSKKQSKSIEHLATDSHERSLVSTVVCSEDIGVKFDDVGALENVKKPELFSHGNLLKPCFTMDGHITSIDEYLMNGKGELQKDVENLRSDIYGRIDSQFHNIQQDVNERYDGFRGEIRGFAESMGAMRGEINDLAGLLRGLNTGFGSQQQPYTPSQHQQMTPYHTYQQPYQSMQFPTGQFMGSTSSSQHFQQMPYGQYMGTSSSQHYPQFQTSQFMPSSSSLQSPHPHQSLHPHQSPHHQQPPH